MGRNDWRKIYNNGDLIRVDESFDSSLRKRWELAIGDLIMCCDHTGDGHHRYVPVVSNGDRSKTHFADLNREFPDYGLGDAVGAVEKKQFHLLMGGESVSLSNVFKENRTWVVELKESKSENKYEYSVVIEGSHGQSSWGWNDGKNKIVLFSGEFKGNKHLPAQMVVCEKVAKALNEMKYSVGDEK